MSGLYENLLVHKSVKYELLHWCNGRGCAPTDVIERLMEDHLEELEDEFPKEVDEFEEYMNTKADLKYERHLDEMYGM